MVVGSLIQFLQVVILARLLAPEDFGVFALTLVFIRFCQPLVEMGFGSAIIQKKELSQVEISTLFWVNLMLGMSFFVVLYFSAPFIANYFDEPLLQKLLPFISLVFLIGPFGFQQQALLQKNFIFGALTFSNLSGLAGEFLTSVLLAWKGYGVWSLAFGYLAKIILQNLIVVFVGWLRYGFMPRFKFDYHKAKPLIRFGFFESGSLLTNFISANIDKIIIGKILGTGALGIYTIIWELIMVPIGRINPIFTKIAFPIFSKIQDHSDKLKSWYEKLSKVILLVNTPIYILLSFFAFEALTIFYGDEWAVGATTLSWMAIVVWIKAFGNPGAVVILAKGKSEIGFFWNLAWAAVVSVLVFGLLCFYPKLEAVGWAQLIGIAPMTAIWHLAVKQTGKFGYSTVIRNFFRITGLNILALIPVIILTVLSPVSGLNALLFGSAIFVSSYILLLYTFEKQFLFYLYKTYR
jgi:O-antigen/teichoic acid export membrane protein